MKNIVSANSRFALGLFTVTFGALVLANGKALADSKDERIAELERKFEQSLAIIEELSKKVESLENTVNSENYVSERSLLTGENAPQAIETIAEKTPSLKVNQKRRQELYTGQVAQTKSQSADSSAPSLVDLSNKENESIEENGASHVLARPWWKNFEIHGFGAVGYYDTGSAGTRDHGNFEIKEASLFLDADIWENIGLFVELQTNRLDKDDQLFTRTGEVYIHFRDINVTDEFSFGAKLGRIDLPFGEEYLWQDAIDNPLITNSAHWLYGWDEGALLYGDVKGLNWIVAVSDGTDKRSSDENGDKAVNVKLFGNPLEQLYLSMSLMRTGKTSKSAIEWAGSHFQPIRAFAWYLSSLGDSTSAEVSAYLGEATAKFHFESAPFDGYLSLTAGAADMNDADVAFSREFFWFTVEPFIRLNREWYGIVRYSEIGTYDANAGYHFDGKIFAGGDRAFSFDTRRLRRLAIGLGWTPNPHVRIKLEVGQDWFKPIDAFPLVVNNKNRKFFGFETAVGF